MRPPKIGAGGPEKLIILFVWPYTLTQNQWRKRRRERNEEGKKNEGKKSVAQTWLDLNSVPLHGNGPIRLVDSV